MEVVDYREQIIDMGLENCKFLFGGDPIILTAHDKSTQKVKAFVVDRRKCQFLTLQQVMADDQPVKPAYGMESVILVSGLPYRRILDSVRSTWSNYHISSLYLRTTVLMEEKLQANVEKAKELEDAIKTEFERLSINIDDEEVKKELWDQLLSQALQEKNEKEEQHKAVIRERVRQLLNKPTEAPSYASSVFTETTEFTDSTIYTHHAAYAHSAHSNSHNSDGSGDDSSSQPDNHMYSQGQNTADLIHELLQKQRDDLTMKFEKEARDAQEASQGIEEEATSRCQRLQERIEELEKKLGETGEQLTDALGQLKELSDRTEDNFKVRKEDVVEAPNIILQRYQSELDIQKLRSKLERSKTGNIDQHLNVKVYICSQFRSHMGFDVGDFDKLDAIATAKPLNLVFRRTQTINDLFELIAEEFNVQLEQLKLRPFTQRENKTMRPDDIITDLGMSFEKLGQLYPQSFPECRLWLEVIKESEKTHPFFKDPAPNNPHILVLLKYYDPLLPALFGMKHVYVNSNDKVASLVQIIMEMMEWHAETDIKLLEEVTPTRVDILTLDRTFKSQEIGDGDIIWFTKASKPGLKASQKGP
ncbi:ICP0-binding domain of ubiquitin-specific protease 7-domain-containing protein [Pyronema omphalodes]|nr:ICP0-binding domain of ubiquitin-specific protease 7-domain-containing protein [Pyronema omphalodes]